MADKLSSREREVASLLVGAGFSREEAVAAIVLTTRKYSRPEKDITSTLLSFAELSDPDKASSAVSGLKAKGYLIESKSDGSSILSTIPDIRLRIEADTCKKGVAQTLLEARKLNDDYARIIGPLQDQISYSTYLDLLKNAQNEILMIHVMTDPSALEAMKIIENRANAGVKVKILGASKRLAAKLRGNSMQSEATRRIIDWKHWSRKVPNAEYRVSEDTGAVLFATSILIDGEILRMVIHDPITERSKEGLLIEFNSDGFRNLNIVVDFRQRFFEAWHQSSSPSFLGYLDWLLRSFWQISCGLGFTILAILVLKIEPTSKGGIFEDTNQAVLGSIFASFAASLIFTGIIEVWRKIQSNPRIKPNRENT